MKSIAFFNNKGGVGKTTLLYHLAWMLSEHGIRVLALDLDPQANLTAMFLNEERLEDLWPDTDIHPNTIYGAISPILRGTGDISIPNIEKITPNLGLLSGDLGLSNFEDKLSDAWPRCHNRDESAFRIMSAFYRLAFTVAQRDQYDLVLIDVGPNLGAINRAALIAAEYVVLPLSADLFSLQGLRNLGPTLKTWRNTWIDLQQKAPADLPLPSGKLKPIGYVVSQHGVRESRPVKSYQRWVERIPSLYREKILNESADNAPSPQGDPHALALLRHYRSLMPMAMDAHKPMFLLRPADGAIGAHVEAVQSCYRDFLHLAQSIAQHINLTLK